jgi:hypothetical protein
MSSFSTPLSASNVPALSSSSEPTSFQYSSISWTWNWVAGREVVEDLRLEHVDAAVAEVRQRLGGVGLLLKAGDPPAGVMQDDAELARVLHPLDRQRRDTAGLAVAGQQAGDVDVGQRVAGDDEERRVAEKVPALANAAGRTGQLGLIEVLDAVAEVVADRVGEVVQVGDDPLDALATQQVDDVAHHRAVEDRHHRLGDLERQRAQARAEPGGEDLGRDHRVGKLPSGRR